MEKEETAFIPRTVDRVARGVPASDGAGVRLTRIISSPAVGVIDPFLLLDEFGSDQAADYLPGFPDHPHRGFDTVTYMLSGSMRHRDNHGHEGTITTGGIQWMRAGRGIIHSEMPQQERGVMRGFQLWVNLPRQLKMSEPGYQEFSADQIPRETRDDRCSIRVIAGRTSRDTSGAVTDIPTAPVYFHVSLSPAGEFREPLDEKANVCVYVESGAIRLGPDGRESERLEAGTLAVMGPGGGVRARSLAAPGSFLLLAARPLNEPIAWSGPFVMNSSEELQQAFDDYRHGRF